MLVEPHSLQGHDFVPTFGADAATVVAAGLSLSHGTEIPAHVDHLAKNAFL